MPSFAKNERISLKQNPSMRGYIDEVYPIQGGHQFYDVKLDDGTLQTLAEHDLLSEIIVQSPWVLLENNTLSDYRNFSIASTLHKVRNTTSNTISTLKASRTLFKPYQFKPLVKFLKSNQKRILIADEVGLGKTIEAGHIMLEMAARNNLRNALVICTKSLSEKWKTELQEKFNFILKIYNSVKDFVEDIRNDISAYRKSVFGIINYEKCRNKSINKILGENSYSFDLLICDEAHKIRNSETAQHKGVSLLVDHSEAVAFLTATPIMTDISNLHNLVRVLDREAYDNFDIFNNAVNQNKPFIKALSKLNSNYPLPEIAEELHQSTVLQQVSADEVVFFSHKYPISELFKNDELYLRVRDRMLENIDNLENRVRIQQDLIELNSLNNLYTRTRKKDVLSDKDKIIRKPHTITVNLTDEERSIYDAVIDEYDNPDSLGLMQRKRQMSSCIVAFREKREDLAAGEYDHTIADSKFEAFKTILDEVVFRKKSKLIVFAFFTNTLLYLRAKLHELKIKTELIYGGVNNRAECIDNFHNNDEIKVLLSSEVGSEGLDMQFCDAMVNYDLPWNPMVVEQRIGRIDRVGQASPVVHIYNLVITETIEEKIYTRLYQRINLFRESIGDLEEILGEAEPLSEKIKKGIDLLYTKRLSEAQQNKLLDETARAIESEKQNLNKIREDLQDAFANDLHFQNEIESIEKNKRYITREEIIKYLEAILRLHLSVLHLNQIEDTIYELEVPANNMSLLFDFIEEYKDNSTINPELDNLYKKFKAKHSESRKIRLTFDQQFAYNHRGTEYISAFHPFVNAITNFFHRKGYDKNQAHKVAISNNIFDDDKKLTPGYYVLAIYRIGTRKMFGDGKSSEILQLQSVLADLNGDEITLIDKRISDHLVGLAQLQGQQMFENLPFNNEAVKEIRRIVGAEIMKEQGATLEDEKVKFFSSVRRRTEQELNYIEKRITRMERFLVEGKGIEAILKKDIRDLQNKKEQLLATLDNSRLEVNNSLVSVNLIQVL